MVPATDSDFLPDIHAGAGSADVKVAMSPAPGGDAVDRGGTPRMVTPWPARVGAVMLPWTRPGGHGGWATTAAAGNDFG